MDVMRCSRCRLSLPYDAFSPSQVAKGYAWCRNCHNEHRRDKRAGIVRPPENPTCNYCGIPLVNRRIHARWCSSACSSKGWRVANPSGRRMHMLRFNYGLEPEDYEAMIVAQSGRCAICLAAFDEDRRICVDHDHGDRRVRGLLCDDCNTGLGRFRDDVAVLRRAVEYLS